jgi:hypothetical protein
MAACPVSKNGNRYAEHAAMLGRPCQKSWQLFTGQNAPPDGLVDEPSDETVEAFSNSSSRAFRSPTACRYTIQRTRRDSAIKWLTSPINFRPSSANVFTKTPWSSTATRKAHLQALALEGQVQMRIPSVQTLQLPLQGALHLSVQDAATQKINGTFLRLLGPLREGTVLRRH